MYILDDSQRKFVDENNIEDKQEKIVGPFCFLSTQEIVLHCKTNILRNFYRYNQVSSGDLETLGMIKTYQQVLQENGINIHDSRIWQEEYFKQEILSKLPNDFFVNFFPQIIEEVGKKDIWSQSRLLFERFRTRVDIPEEKGIVIDEKGGVFKEAINIDDLLFLEEDELKDIPEKEQEKIIRNKSNRLRRIFHPDKIQGYFDFIEKYKGLKNLGLKREEIIYILKFFDKIFNKGCEHIDYFYETSLDYQNSDFMVDFLGGFIDKKEFILDKIREYFIKLNHIYRNGNHQMENIIFEYDIESLWFENEITLHKIPINQDFILGYAEQSDIPLYKAGIMRLYFNKDIIPYSYKEHYGSYFNFISVGNFIAFVDYNNGKNIKYHYLDDFMKELKSDKFFYDMNDEFQTILLGLLNERKLGIEDIIQQMMKQYIIIKTQNNTIIEDRFPPYRDDKTENDFILRRLLNEIFNGPRFVIEEPGYYTMDIHIIQENHGLLFLTNSYDTANQGLKGKEFFLSQEDIENIRTFVNRKKIANTSGT